MRHGLERVWPSGTVLCREERQAAVAQSSYGLERRQLEHSWCVVATVVCVRAGEPRVGALGRAGI